MGKVAQKTKEAEITEQDSLLLTRNLLRIAIFNISYIRGLFPENYFNDKSVAALDMKVKKLMPIDLESRRLIDWMEKGVYDALQKKYLKTLLFCICESIEGPMIEEYAFSFTYASSNNEEVSMNVNRRGNKRQGATFKANTTEITPEQMRFSACKMVRTLVQLMRTLDQMPDERTILMKLHYYEDITPEDYEPPFFRCCSESESSNTWTKNPLKMEVGNVNSKHLVLALKVKSTLDPCEDDNDNNQEDEMSLAVNSAQQDDFSSDTDVDLSQENQYVLAPAGERSKHKDNSMADEEHTQDAEIEEENTTRIRDWIHSRIADTVDLTDFLTAFPDISLALTEEIIDKMLKEGSISKSGKDSYVINREKAMDCDDADVKEETDTPANLQAGKAHNNNRNGFMYMKALYHALLMDYVTIAKLQKKLEGEVSHSTVKKFIEKMVLDGFVQSTGIRKLGKPVIHSEFTKNKFQEVERALENKTSTMETFRHPFEFNGLDVAPQESDLKNGSTCAGLHSIGSDFTRTRVQSDVQNNASLRSEHNCLTKTEDNRTPTSKVEPISSLESGVNRKEKVRDDYDHIPHEADVSVCSRSTLDKRIRKIGRVREPILQYVKRQKMQVE